MSVGGALAKARDQAGLTVREVSQRTRIRETIIRDIERDEFSTCGGDFYARGHIRAIAKVIDTDPVPLIEEYDAEHLAPEHPPDGWTAPDGPHVGDITQAGWSSTGTKPGSAPQSAGPPRTMGISAAEAFRPSMPLRARRAPPNWSIVLALLLLAVIAILVYLLVSGSSHSSGLPINHSPATSAAGSIPTSPRPTNSASPASRATSNSAAVAALQPASVAAFGPGGTSQGDNPLGASLAVDQSATTAWHTDWYTTADFGHLQHGTGLLLDMGKTVLVARVQMTMGRAAGALIQLRAGNTATPASLQPIAASAGSGGTVTLQPARPVHTRYLLIWFTRLPPDGSGTYEAFLYNVRVTGSV